MALAVRSVLSTLILLAAVIFIFAVVFREQLGELQEFSTVSATSVGTNSNEIPGAFCC